MKLIDSIFRTSTNKLLQLALVQDLFSQSYVGLLAATASDFASLSLMAIDFIRLAAIYRLAPLDLGPFGQPRSALCQCRSFCSPAIFQETLSGYVPFPRHISKTTMPRERWHTSQARALDLVERTFERCKPCQCREPYGSDTVGGNRYRVISNDQAYQCSAKLLGTVMC